MRVLSLVVACAVVMAGCATPGSLNTGGPSGADTRGARHVRRAPDSPSPPASGARYALRVDAARAAIRDGEGRQALAAYQRLAAELEAKGAKSDAALAHSLASMAAVSVGGFQQGIRSGLRALELLKGESLTGPGVQAMVLAYNQVALLSRGDELVGLQRAFLYAGTPAVITTLWKVDDRASFLLMRTFYEQLPTLGPARALREAQRAATKEFPHPFAWAAFGLTGSPR